MSWMYFQDGEDAPQETGHFLPAMYWTGSSIAEEWGSQEPPVLRLLLILQDILKMSGHDRSWSILALVAGLFLAKAHFHMMKLLIMGAAGLGGMYMMHNLAQDFNKIQKQWNKGTGGVINQQLSSLGGLFTMELGNIISSSRTRRSVKEDWLMEKFPNDTKTMSFLVKNDPMGCARKYVCYISSKSAKKRTPMHRNVLGILRTFSWLDPVGEWSKAQDIGRLLGRRGGCEAGYSNCGYTGAQLDQVMSALGT